MFYTNILCRFAVFTGGSPTLSFYLFFRRGGGIKKERIPQMASTGGNYWTHTHQIDLLTLMGLIYMLYDLDSDHGSVERYHQKVQTKLQALLNFLINISLPQVLFVQ